jgi:hypothetical protein
MMAKITRIEDILRKAKIIIIVVNIGIEVRAKMSIEKREVEVIQNRSKSG